MSNTELKPCPFCGGEAKWGNTDHNWVECKNCKAENGYYMTAKDAAEAWNRRVNE